MPPSDDSLPPSRIVRWMLLAGVILFSAGLYFRYGLKIPPIGAAPVAPTPSSAPAR